MVSAEYGGTGGKPIQAGMVVEEPDIEIGAGVSSKGKLCRLFILVTLLTLLAAMSKRIPTDQGGRRGPQSSNRDDDERDRHRDRDRRGRNDRYRDNRDDRRDDRPGSSGMNNNPNFTAMPFPMPGFPTMPNGMPMFPPGFNFPGFPMQGQSQDSTMKDE